MAVLNVVVSQSDDAFDIELMLDEESILLKGGGFSDKDKALEGVEVLLGRLSFEGSLVLASAGGGIELRLLGANGETLGTSDPLPTPNDAEALREQVLSLASSQERYDITLRTIHETTTVSSVSALSRDIDVSTFYDFAILSKTQAAGVERFDGRDGHLFFFHINDSDGLPLLYGRHYESASKREERLRQVLRNGSVESRYERRSDESGHYFIVKARNGWEIARSRLFAQESEIGAYIAWLMERASGWLEEVPEAKTRREVSDQYDLTLVGVSGEVGFEELKTAGERPFYFLFNGQDSAPLIFSQGYTSRRSRLGGMRSTIKNGGLPERYKVQSNDEGWFFTLKAGNHQELARSRYFLSEVEVWEVILWFRTVVVTFAGQYGVVLTTGAEVSTEHLTLSVDRDAPLAPGAPLGSSSVAVAVLAASGAGALSGDAAGAEADDETGSAEDDEEEGEEFEDVSISEVVQEALWERTQETSLEDGMSEEGQGDEDEDEDEEEDEDEIDTLSETIGSVAGLAAGAALGASGRGDDPWESMPTQIGTPAEPSPPPAAPLEVSPTPPPADPAPAAPPPEIEPPEAAPSEAPPAAAPSPTAASSSIREPAPPGAPVDAHDEPLEAPSPWRWLLPLLAILLLLLLLALFSSRCGSQGQDDVGPVSIDAPAGDSAAGDASAGDSAAGHSAPVRAAPPKASPTPKGSAAVDAVAVDAAEVAPAIGDAGSSEAARVEAAAIEAARAEAAQVEAAAIEAAKVEAAAIEAARVEAAKVEAAVLQNQASGNAGISPSGHLETLGGHEASSKVPTLDRAALDLAPMIPGSTEAELLAFLKGDDPGPKVFIMSRLNYGADSHEVDDAGKEQIYYIAQILNAYPGATMEIHGHNDGIESEIYTGPNPRDNLPLSELRADCVLRRLTWLDVPGSSLSLYGHGDSKPVTKELGDAARQANRRVELVVTKD